MEIRRSPMVFTLAFLSTMYVFPETAAARNPGQSDSVRLAHPGQSQLVGEVEKPAINDANNASDVAEVSHSDDCD